MEDLVSGAGLQAFVGQRVLVTGDSGFKGSWLALWLAEVGAEVFGLSLPPEPTQILFPQLVASKRLRHVDGDIRDLELVRRVIKDAQPRFIFHLAAQALVRRSYADPQSTFATNLVGSVNVLEAVRECDSIRALVYITSDKCYLNKEWHWSYRENDELGGSDPYSASKACAELAFHAYSCSYFAQRENFGAASTRAGNVIGGGDRSADRVVPDTIAAIEANKPVVLRNPNATRPWQHVVDPLYGYLKLAVALERDPKAFSGAWNFGPVEGSIRTVDDLARTLVASYGQGEVLHEPDLNAPHEASLLHISSEKAHRSLQWHPSWDFERAILESARWYRDVRNGRPAIDMSRDQIAEYMAGLVPL